MSRFLLFFALLFAFFHAHLSYLPETFQRCQQSETPFFTFLESLDSTESRGMHIFRGRKILYSIENELKPEQIAPLAGILMQAGNVTHTKEDLVERYCHQLLHSFEQNCREMMPPLLGRREMASSVALKRKVEKMWRGMRGHKNRSDPNAVTDLISAASGKKWEEFCDLWTDGWFSENIYDMDDEEVYDGAELKKEYKQWKKEWEKKASTPKEEL